MDNITLAIRIRNLEKNYGSVRALRGVNLEVQRGEVFGFLGPNGAGKTTTIRCMLDLIRPNAGQIEVLGLNPQRDPLEVRSRLGYLPGELNMESNQTVEGQLRYLDDLRGKHTDMRFANQLAERIDLDMKTQIKNLSKGNKQKVGIVQAFMGKPELLLLDEPTSGLDPLIQQEIYQLISEAKENGAAVFFSSHIINEVETIANRVGIIRKGKIVQVAEPEHLINMSVRRVTVRFNQPITEHQLDGVEGVSQIVQKDEHSLNLQVEGDMDQLIKALAKLPVRDLTINHHSLEEIFLQLYKNNDKEND
jgi:ABC-2 type transport system ATP-binding protein